MLSVCFQNSFSFQVHITHNNLSEVAHCKIHVAALVAEYLKRRGWFLPAFDFCFSPEVKSLC